MALVSIFSATGCAPEFDARVSIITGTRILAVRAEPPQGAPGGDVALDALVGTPGGTRTDAMIDWAFCTKPKPLSEPDDVSPAGCFVLASGDLQPVGMGPSVQGKLPMNACRQFGPDVPVTDPGQPPGRPADPDLTGGYYQPARLVLPEGAGYVLALGEDRLTCGLAGAPSEVLLDFKKRYHDNVNPEIAALTANGAPVDKEGQGAPIALGAGQPVDLVVSWPDCANGAMCGGQEPYVAYDPESRTLDERREAMEVAWYATAGTFDVDRSGASESAPATSASNRWTAPSAAGAVHLWVVLHDSRGGTAWESYEAAIH